MHDQTNTGQAGEPARVTGGHLVTVLSAALLRAVRAGHRESQEDFAARAGIAPQLLEDVEAGCRPVWDLPYATFTALSDAVSGPTQARTVFETAAACDLMVTCVMRGDQGFSTDVLADDDTRDLAVGLLRWAVTGEFHLPGHTSWVQVPVLWAWHDECGGWICPACGLCPCETVRAGCGHRGQLLSDMDLAVLRRRASELAKSSSPDAWVGAEMLAVFGGAR